MNVLIIKEKKIFYRCGLSEDSEMCYFWIMQGNPKSNDKCPYCRQTEGRLRQKEEERNRARERKNERERRKCPTPHHLVKQS